jgi:hypothetical protein
MSSLEMEGDCTMSVGWGCIAGDGLVKMKSQVSSSVICHSGRIVESVEADEADASDK